VTTAGEQGTDASAGTGSRQPNAIVVGVDTSNACLDAARWAAREAVVRGTTLRLLHASVFGRLPHDGHQSGRQDDDLLLESADRWIGLATAAAVKAAPRVRVVSEVRLGIAPELLVEESASAALIVVGSHGLGGLRGLLVGSVALKVAAQASCPVIVMRGPAAPLEGPIVVGVDDSAESERAVEFAMEIACVREVPLVVVHAWHEETSRAALAEKELRERHALENRMDSWGVKYPEVEIRVSAVRDRDAAHALLGQSVGAQLLVVGSRGRGPVAGGLLGSTGNALLSTASCPVAVAHERRQRRR